MSDRASLVHGYVLAGGASSRFGTDKALAEFQGQTILARTAKLLSTAVSAVKIVSPTAKLSDAAYKTIPDRWPGEGPLGGILTALLDAQSQSDTNTWCLIVSCARRNLERRR